MKWITKASSHVTSVKSPKTFFLSHFNTNTVEAFQSVVSQCVDNSQPLLPIFIESDGGYVDSLASILSIMDYGRAMGMEFSTITTGRASSCGALTFCYGDTNRRYISSTGSILLHNFQVGGAGQLHEVHNSFINNVKSESALFEKVSKHLKKPKDWLQKNLHKNKNYDWILNAEECKKEGIASEIKIPSFVLSVEERFIIV